MKNVVIVTGGAGFIGSHAVDLLIEKGFAVRVLDNLSGGRLSNIEHHMSNPDFEFVEGDILNLGPGDAFFSGVKYVIHFAGIGDIVPSIEKPIDYMEVNLLGTVRVLECCKASGIERFVYAASSSCYGIADVPTDEKHSIKAQYPYALSKFQGEQAAFHWQKVYGLSVNSVRIFNAYGTRSRTSGAYGAVFGVFLRQLIAGSPLSVVGDGTQKRDFLYVTDVAEAFVMAAQTKLVGQVWNLGAGNPQSVNRIVELLGGKVVYIPKRPGEPDCTYADISKISKDLGWSPKVSFEDGISRLLANIDYWKEAPLWSPSSIEVATKTWFTYLGKDSAD